MFATVKSKEWLKVYGMDHSPKIGKIVGWNLRTHEAIEAFLDHCEKNVEGECLSGDGVFKKRASVVANVLKESRQFTAELLQKAAQGSPESKVLGTLKKEFDSAQGFSDRLGALTTVSGHLHAEMKKQLEKIGKAFALAKAASGTGANDKHQSLAQAETFCKLAEVVEFRIQLLSAFPWGSGGSTTSQRDQLLGKLKNQKSHALSKAKETGETHHMH
jgi:hypothetical protein